MHKKFVDWSQIIYGMEGWHNVLAGHISWKTNKTLLMTKEVSRNQQTKPLVIINKVINVLVVIAQQ